MSTCILEKCKRFIFSKDGPHNQFQCYNSVYIIHHSCHTESDCWRNELERQNQESTIWGRKYVSYTSHFTCCVYNLN